MPNYEFPKWVEDIYAATRTSTNTSDVCEVFETPDDEDDSFFEKIDLLLGDEEEEEDIIQ